MATVRTLSNGNKLTDWTEEVNDIANQYGMINGMNLFSGRGTSDTSIIFDKSTNQTLILPQVNRNAGPATKGTDRTVETFSIPLPYFLHQDYITPMDIQSHRKPGTSDDPETLANVMAIKLEDMKLVADQTREFMKIQAIKGITKDGYGNVIVDMFDKFGRVATDYEVDFDLGTAATEVDLKIGELRRRLSRDAVAGSAIGAITCMVSPAFFDALTTHPKIREAYLQYSVVDNRSDVVRGDLQRYEKWGVVDTFYHKGVLFWSYDARFVVDGGDGTTSTVVAVGDTASRDAVEKSGFTIVTGLRNLFLGTFGPANTLSGANAVGSEVMMYQYTDPKDKFHEMEMEMANLYHITRPQASYRVFSST